VAAQGCGLALLAVRARTLLSPSRTGAAATAGGLRRPVFFRALRRFLGTAGVMILRNWGKIFCFTSLARQAALHGSVVAGAYSLTFQLGFATSQVAESLATSTQVMLARALPTARGESDEQGRPPFAPLTTPRVATHVVSRGLQAGLVLSVILSTITLLSKDVLLRLLTNDELVYKTASAAMTWVLAAQVLKAMAYPMNGALMGALDWSFSAVSLWLAGFAGVGLYYLCRPAAAAGEVAALGSLWVGLVGFFGVQLVLGLLRIAARRGPWRALREAKEAKA